MCTDDTIFLHTCPSQAERRLHALDESFADKGIPRRADKDENIQDSITALGCHVANSPIRVEPALDKLINYCAGTIDLVLRRRGSPVAVNALLGVAQWFALMARGMFAVFDEIYEFVRREPQDTPQLIPDSVAHELLVFMLLAPLLVADLTRQFFPALAACDAAPEYGFGVSVCTITDEEAQTLGTYAEKRGDYVRFQRTGDDDEEPQKPRQGVPRELRIRQCHFHDVFSLKARTVEHSGVMEARGCCFCFGGGCGTHRGTDIGCCC